MASIKDELLDGLSLVTGFLAVVPILWVFVVAFTSARAALAFFAVSTITAIAASIVANWPTRRRRWFFAAGLVFGTIASAALIVPFFLGNWKN